MQRFIHRTRIARSVTRRSRFFDWLTEKQVVGPAIESIKFRFISVPPDQRTDEVVKAVCHVASTAFSGDPTSTTLEKRLTNNERSPHRQLESGEELTHDILSNDCLLFIGLIRDQIVFFCIIRLGLDEPAGSPHEGGLSCLNYELFYRHVRGELEQKKVAFILSIGLIPECQGILDNAQARTLMIWMLDSALPHGGIVCFDFAERINPTMKRLNLWLGWPKGHLLGLPPVSVLEDSQKYEIVHLYPTN